LPFTSTFRISVFRNRSTTLWFFMIASDETEREHVAAGWVSPILPLCRSLSAQ
jgi:hypothetical protein